MKVKKGDIVEVEFLDHVCTAGGIASPMKCRAIGEVLSTDKKAIYLASWLTEEPDDYLNMDSHTILKTTISKLTKLKKLKNCAK